MQTPGKPTPNTLAMIIAVATMAYANLSLAQDAVQNQAPAEGSGLSPAQEALAQDFYRAEFVILERRVDPSDIDEKMTGRLPEPPDLGADDILRHTDQNGEALTTMDLVSWNELHLTSAAKRLENSGRYRVLLAEGWYQAFPPDFEGKPLWVTIGDWLPEAGHTDVQGMITIDRQRYLHVDVQLNHWMPESATDNLIGLDLNAETPTRPHPPQVAIEPAIYGPEPSGQASAVVSRETDEPLEAGLNWPRAELVTWIQETRRMRSEEVHFLDSPTIGVLIFFKKIEPEDAAPLILDLGLTGESEEEPREAP